FHLHSIDYARERIAQICSLRPSLATALISQTGSCLLVNSTSTFCKSRWRTSMPSSDNLIWIDLEMTGLEPESDSIIEIATVVTDKELVVIADGPVFAIHQSEEV